MDIQDEQDKNRRSSGVTFSFIGGTPQARVVYMFVVGDSSPPDGAKAPTTNRSLSLCQFVYL
jgi:hypothetical protein